MQRRKLIALTAFLAILAFSTVAVISTNAFTLVNGVTNPGRWMYVVKFICNTGQDPNAALNIGLAPGFYYTDINIHNPSFQKSSDTIVKKFVLADPEPVAVGTTGNVPTVNADPTPSVIQTVILGPDAAVRVDCKEILNLLSTSAAPLTTAKGFVEIITTRPITSPGNLDVWAEYSTQSVPFCVTTSPTQTSPGCSNAPSIEVVQVQPSQFVP